MVTNKVLDFIYDTHGRRIKEWKHDLLRPANLQTYADAVWVQPLKIVLDLWTVLLELCTMGTKRVHALKFQSVALPNGIIANMYGPVGGYFFNQF